MNRDNPSISPIVKAMLAVEVLVLITSGFLLFFAVGTANTVWPWQIKPFNGGFLGAIYLAALIGVAALLIIGKWNPARVILPMIFSFTICVFVITLLNWSAFDTSRWGTWSWIILYALIPTISGIFWWRGRNLPAVDAKTTPSLLGNYLLLQAVVLAVYGVAMLVVPVASTAFWPWAIDTFHAQLYAGTAISGAVGSFLVSRQGSSLEFLLVGLMEAVLAAFSLLDVFLKSDKVNYSLAGTLLWVAAFVVGLVVGLILVARSRRMA
jgi:hypothetical protein